MATDVEGTPRPPWLVLAYLPVHVVWSLAFSVAQGGGPAVVARDIVALLIPVAISIGLWRRARVAWIIAVLLEVLAILLGIAHVIGDMVALGAVQIGGAVALLALLLHPDTRRWCG